MKYDFTTILDREGKDAIAVDGLGKMERSRRWPFYCMPFI